MFAAEIPSQFGDGIDVDAFWRVGFTDKVSQIGQHSLGYFCLCRKHVYRELITSLSAFMYTCNQVALTMRENRPVLSAPVNAWNAGKAFALSGPMALHIGSIRITPEAIEIDVFLSIRS